MSAAWSEFVGGLSAELAEPPGRLAGVDPAMSAAWSEFVGHLLEELAAELAGATEEDDLRDASSSRAGR